MFVLSVTEYIQKVSRPLHFTTVVDMEIYWTENHTIVIIIENYLLMRTDN